MQAKCSISQFNAELIAPESGSRASILSMVFKLAQSVEQRWQKLRGAEMIAKVITGIQFRNGVEVPKKNRQKIAA